MIAACAVPVNAGVMRGVMAAVDCRTRDFAQSGYRALTGEGSFFPQALTLALTIYVALLGYRMLLARDGARLADLPVIGVKIGAVLALVGGWSTFQTLVFDLADKVPVEVAAIVSRPVAAQGSSLVRDPVGGLQVAYDQLSAAAGAFGAAAGPTARIYTSAQAAAAEALTGATGALFVSTAGVLSVAAMAIGVLTATGPIFVALFLFRQTRGVFVGWVRALLVSALVPAGAWILIVLELTAVEPWLLALAQQRQEGLLDPQTGLTGAALVFVFAFAQAVFLILAGVIGGGFRLPLAPAAPRAAEPGPERASVTSIPVQTRAQALAQSLHRPGMALVAETGFAAPQTAARMAAIASQRTAGPASPHFGDSYRRPAVRQRSRGGQA